MKEFYRILPDLVKSLLITSEGWLVGNSIKDIMNHKDVNDYDIIVSKRELYQIAVKQLSVGNKVSINSYGGLKFETKDGIIDIWCEELSHFLMTSNNVNMIYNHKKQILIEKK